MKNSLNPAGWVRLVIYVISALVGVGAVVATSLGYGDVAATLGTLAGAGAAVTGGTAVYNLPKAPDQSALSGYDFTALAPAIQEILELVKNHKDSTVSETTHTKKDVELVLDAMRRQEN